MKGRLVSSLSRSRFWRTVAAATLAAVVWLVAYFSWPWLAAAVTFVLLAALSTLISDKVPVVVERVAGSEPLNAAVGADLGFYSDGWSVALAHDVGPGETPPQGLEHLEARNRLFEAGAFDLDESHLLLTLEGRSVDPVRVTGLRCRVTSRSTPLSGAVVRSPSSGEQPIVAAQFDLEQDEARARENGVEYFRDYTLTLGRGESFMFRIVASVERSTCEWELVLDYMHRGAQHELVMDNAGRPFRTAAAAEQLEGSYEWAWHGPPPRLVRSSPR